MGCTGPGMASRVPFRLLLPVLLAASVGCSTYPRLLALDVYAADSVAGGFVAARGVGDGPRVTARAGTRVLEPVTGALVRCDEPCLRVRETARGSYEVTLGEPKTPVDHVDILVTRPGLVPVVVRAPVRTEPPYSSRFIVLMSQEAP